MMGLHTKLPDEIQEVDVIIAGGGTAGCVVAARLAQADPSLSILVIESGPNNFNDPTVIHPAFFFSHLAPDSKNTLFYTAQKSELLGGREAVVPCGSVLGGGSSVNFMMYTRAQRSDFDDWATPGWSAEEMIPYLKKLETYHGKGATATHGQDGPVQISEGTFCGVKAQNDFINAATRLGWSEIDDMQSLDAINGVQRAVRYVAPDGKRQDTAHQYLHPLLQDGKHPNLNVLVETQVARVVLENGRASGLIYRPNPKFSQTSPNLERTIKARKLVIVSAGAFGTPLILERSGIGNPDILKRAGIPLVADLPGVGNDYEDHQLGIYAYKSSLEPEDTLDALGSGRLDVGDLMKNNSPLLGYNGQDVTGKFRPTDDEVAALGPEFQKAWDEHFKNKPDKPLALMAMTNCFPGVDPTLPQGQYVGLTAFSVYPFSRGHVHITGPTPDDPVDFDTGFFADANAIDIKKHIWLYKKQREIMRRMRVYRGEVPSMHPQFSADSNAALVTLDAPLPDDVKNIQYTAEDDEMIKLFLREKIGTTWHSMGTCKMAPREKKGVVDSSLSVYGVEGLKIADLSIPPGNVGANTNNTAIAVGEKAADIFIHELGLGK